MKLWPKILFSLPLVACTSCEPIYFPEPPQKSVAKVETDQLVGRVSTLYMEHDYLLIQKIRTIRPDSDAIYYIRTQGGQTEQIQLTGQKLGQFYVADYTGNRVGVNDPVFRRILRKKSETHANEADRQATLP